VVADFASEERMSDEPVSLEFLARQIRGMRDDIHALKDDMGVLTAIVLRHERQLDQINETQVATLNQITAMVRQHQRFSEPLRAMEEERR
jgi:hypothetical protein